MEKVIEFLYRVKERPYIYVGNPVSYERLLEAFSGYTLCLCEECNDIDSSYFMLAFLQYIYDYYGVKGVLRKGLYLISMFTETDETAFYKFYELLDAFVQQRESNANHV